MNRIRNASSLAALASLLIVGIACNQSSSADTPTANSANAANSGTAATTAPSPTKDISGNYTVTGQNEGGGGDYGGELTVTKRDQVYQFSWTSGDKGEFSPWMRLWRNARRWVG